MKFISAMMAGAVSAFSASESTYLRYLMEHGKSYSDLDEFMTRFGLFKDRYNEIQKINAAEENFQLGLNKMTDWSQREIELLLGQHQVPLDEIETEPPTYESTPSSVDWRSSGCVTAVKDQASCGSCWTFAGTEAVESAWCIAGNPLYILSEQQMVDCITTSHGCDGGNDADVFTYLQTHYAMKESAYPYKAVDGTCKYSKSNATNVQTTGKTYVSRNVSSMKSQVAKGPMAVSVDASSTIFHHYSSGVIDSKDCGTSHNHAILAVGYGHDKTSGLDYWLVRNSWGKSWGDNGYVKIAITNSPTDSSGNLIGICAIGTKPVSPKV